LERIALRKKAYSKGGFSFTVGSQYLEGNLFTFSRVKMIKVFRDIYYSVLPMCDQIRVFECCNVRDLATALRDLWLRAG
jgi:hypothetical protein